MTWATDTVMVMATATDMDMGTAITIIITTITIIITTLRPWLRAAAVGCPRCARCTAICPAHLEQLVLGHLELALARPKVRPRSMDPISPSC